MDSKMNKLENESLTFSNFNRFGNTACIYLLQFQLRLTSVIDIQLTSKMVGGPANS